MIAITAASALMGLATPLSKSLLTVQQPTTVALERWMIALVALGLWTGARHMGRPRGSQPIQPDDSTRSSVHQPWRPTWWTLPVLGLCQVSVAYAALNLGLERTTAVTGTLVIDGGIPVFTAVLGAVVLRERIERHAKVGLMIAIGGVGLVAGSDRGANLDPGSGRALAAAITTGQTLVGIGVLLVSAASIAVATVILRHGMQSGSGHSRGSSAAPQPATTLPHSVTTAIIGWGVVGLFPFAALEVATHGLGHPRLSNLLMLVVLGVGCSAVALVLWNHGVSNLTAVEGAAFSTISPAVGVVGAGLLLGETIGLGTILGAIGIIVGILITTRERPEPNGSERAVRWSGLVGRHGVAPAAGVARGLVAKTGGTLGVTR